MHLWCSKHRKKASHKNKWTELKSLYMCFRPSSGPVYCIYLRVVHRFPRPPSITPSTNLSGFFELSYRESYRKSSSSHMKSNNILHRLPPELSWSLWTLFRFNQTPSSLLDWSLNYRVMASLSRFVLKDCNLQTWEAQHRAGPCYLPARRPQCLVGMSGSRLFHLNSAFWARFNFCSWGHLGAIPCKCSQPSYHEMIRFVSLWALFGFGSWGHMVQVLGLAFVVWVFEWCCGHRN